MSMESCGASTGKHIATTGDEGDQETNGRTVHVSRVGGRSQPCVLVGGPGAAARALSGRPHPRAASGWQALEVILTRAPPDRQPRASLARKGLEGEHMKTRVILVSVAVLVSMLAAVHASASPADEGGEGSQIWKLQEPIDKANSKIDELLATNPGWLDYYAGSEADVPNRRLQVNIKPDAPEVLYRELADLGSGVTVSFAEADYSYNEMQTEALRLMQGGALTGVALLSSGDGLKITPSATGSGLAAKRASSADSPMIVEVEDAVTTDPAVATRQNDSSASPGWKGGARIKNGTGGCSTAFGATTSDGRVHLMTAYHCARGTGIKITDGAGETIGTTFGTLPNRDVIRVSAARVAPRVYDGAWNNTAGYYKTVTGKTSNGSGTYVCSSGSYTGVNCNIKITDSTYIYALVGHPTILITGVRAEQQTSGAKAVGKGDSGGPVFKIVSGSSTNRLAAGVISGGQVTVSCGSTASSTCYKRILYQDITRALNGSTIRTG